MLEIQPILTLVKSTRSLHGFSKSNVREQSLVHAKLVYSIGRFLGSISFSKYGFHVFPVNS